MSNVKQIQNDILRNVTGHGTDKEFLDKILELCSSCHAQQLQEDCPLAEVICELELLKPVHENQN
jgi:hypothetical protein